MTSGMVAAEGAESRVYTSLISTPINGDALCSGHPVHGRLGHQIMETKVMVLSVSSVAPVHDLTVAFLYYPDEVLRLYSQVTREKFPGWGVTVQALFNHCPDLVCLLLLTVFFQQFNQPVTRHHVLVREQRLVLLDIPEVSSMVIEVDGLSLLCCDVVFPVIGKFRTLVRVLLPPELVD